MDCIEARLIIDIMRTDEIYEPTHFYKWCSTLCEDVHSYHKSRKKAYKYITPYSVVIDSSNRAHLLDLQSFSNQDLREYIQHCKVKERFALPLDVQRKNKYLADYYSFAKTIQFILSQVQIEPNFSKKQVKQLKRVINTCIGVKRVKYQNMKELQREFVSKKNKGINTVFLMIIAFLLAVSYLYLV